MNDEQTQPLLSVVRGDPSPAEVAALVAVVFGLTAAAAGPGDRAPRSEWAAPRRSVRSPLTTGPGAWRSSTLPR